MTSFVGHMTHGFLKCVATVESRNLTRIRLPEHINQAQQKIILKTIEADIVSMLGMPLYLSTSSGFFMQVLLEPRIQVFFCFLGFFCPACAHRKQAWLLLFHTSLAPSNKCCSSFWSLFPCVQKQETNLTSAVLHCASHYCRHPHSMAVDWPSTNGICQVNNNDCFS